MIWTRPERAARGQRQPLTRERIVRAAIELADEHGLEGVSTRAIASRLGSGPTSMYWHVPTKADLYELMFDAIVGEIPIPTTPSPDWRSDVRALARGTLAAGARHPWLGLLGIQPGVGPHNRRYGEFAITVLTGAGLDHDTALQALALINNYISGFARRRSAWERLKHRGGLEQRWDQRVDQYIVELEATDPPLAEHIKARLHLTSDDSFELGLDCVLDGIAHRLIDPVQAASDTPARS